MSQRKINIGVQFSERLAAKLKVARLKKGDLAAKVGVHPPALSRWLKGSVPEHAHLSALASELNTSVHFLLTGEEVPSSNSGGSREDSPSADAVGSREDTPIADGIGNREAARKNSTDVVGRVSENVEIERLPSLPPRPIVPRWVPLVSWAHAGLAQSYEELPSHWQESIPTTCREERAFALQVEGDSMVPHCQQGDLVVVMPDVEPRHACLVVAKLKNDGVLLRRYLKRPDGRIHLIAYNEKYPAEDYAEDAFHWIYPVHSTVRREWDKS